MASGRIDNPLGFVANTISGTVNTNVCSGGNIYGCRTGNIIWLSGWIRLRSDVTIDSNSVFVSGLPVPINNVNALYFDQNAGTCGSLYIVGGTSDMKTGGYSVTGHEGHVLNFSCTYMAYPG